MTDLRPTAPGTDPVDRHDGLSIALHWAVLVAAVLTYGLGIVREAVPRGPARDTVLLLHISTGLVVLAGAVFRIAWHAGRRGFGFTEPPTTWAGRLAHLGLYAGIILVPLAGLATVWSRGQAVSFFGIAELPQLLPTYRAAAAFLAEAHEVLAHGLIALAGLHALAALGHHVLLRDGVLRGMLPRFR